MKRPATALIPALLALGALSACGTKAPAPQASVEGAETPEASASSPAPSKASDSVSSPQEMDDTEPDSGLIHASEDEIAAAHKGVEATMAVWVKGQSLPQREWEEQLRATLAPESVDLSLSMWGYKVPDTKVLEITAVRADSDSATFEVKTDASTYHVTSLRQSDGKWLVSDLRPAS